MQDLSYLLSEGPYGATEVAQTSYSLDIMQPARRVPPRGPLRHAVALAQASADLEARLYAALRALQHETPDQLQLAIVHGPSLHFSRATWFWTLDTGIPPPSASDAHDTAARQTQRKKTSALLERKLIRHCMMHEALQGPSLAPCPTRVLLYAPHTLRVPGWTPRPHYKATIPPESDLEADIDEVDEVDEVDDAMDETSASHGSSPPPSRHAPRTTRMQLPDLALQCRRTPTRFAPRTKSLAPQAHVVLHGDLRSVQPCQERHVWFACDVVLRGVAEFRDPNRA